MASTPGRLRQQWQAASFRVKVLVGLLALAVFGVMAVVGAWTRACVNDACPAVESLNGYDPDQASKVYAADGREIDVFGSERRTLVTLKQMSPAIPAAFLSAEDKRFYQHHGVDWLRCLGAIKHDIFHIGLGQGCSTITMQLAGSVFPEEIDRSKTGLAKVVRKVREMRVALEIERHFPKDKILELYLNQINLGGGAFGVETASQRYFGKSATVVNVAEAAMLARLPKSPTHYNPRLNPRLAVLGRNLVIGELSDDGYITPAEAEMWKAYPIVLSSHPDYHSDAQDFVEFVRQQMLGKFGDELYTQGLRIYTTLDLDAQHAAVRAVQAQLDKIESGQLGAYHHITYRDYMEQRKDDDPETSSTPYLQGGALVLEARTGHILAMVGARDDNDSKFNRIVQAMRQPGSSFKPIMYTAAVEAGISFDTRYRDSRQYVHMPYGQPDWSPDNYEGRFGDSMLTMREGLRRSLNSVAVQVGEQVGIGAVLEEARRFGITTHIDSVPSIFLGAATLHPIEMIAAYTTFANLGTRVVPNAILRVEDRQGKVLWQPEVQSVPVLDPKVAYTMTQELRGVVTNGTAASAVYAAGFRIPAGGKTGTTNDFNNVWFIGFTPDLVAGVWMGLDNNTKIMSGAQGATFAAPAWTMMMQEIYQRRRDPGDWTPPQ